MEQYKHIFDALGSGKQIEYLDADRNWAELTPKLALENIIDGIRVEDFRIKPKTININGHEVPEPVREPLECGQEYYVPAMDRIELHNKCLWGIFTECDRRELSRGIIHLTREAAEAHAKALLSFTQLPEDAENA